MLRLGSRSAHASKGKDAAAAKNLLPVKPPAAAPARSAPATKASSVATERKVTANDRHRSQRVLLRTRMLIHAAIAGKLTTIEGVTLSVTPLGAIVLTSQNLPPDARVVLEHIFTKGKAACKVAGAARQTPEGFHLPVEFDSPDPKFWGIAFPPKDCNTDDQ